ncbi:efflux RND transporter periplasmic adaptor subunit [uncultured Salinisphaera sp.]|uniref:efflux RND transporter periplasmic adaptor subunit n=1 Tax=uncultured Salinisphaera sp. TaxID=359372 RepID=UPI0032B2BF84
MRIYPSAVQVGAAVFALAVSLLGVGCGSHAENAPAVVAKGKPVRVVEVEPNDEPRTFALSGVTRGGSRARLAFQIGGRISDIEVQVGSAVKKGDVIARLQQPGLEQGEDAARSQVAQARAQRDQAERDLDRAQTLYSRDAATQQTLENARARAEAARAQLRGAQAQLEQASRGVAQQTLRAPIDGTIEMVLFEPGEVVPPGQPIVGLSGAQKIEVAIGIPERLLASVETGQPAQLTLPLFDNRKITGTLTAVSHAAGGPGRLFEAVIGIDKSADIVPGMSVVWHVSVPPKPGVLVPPDAIARPGGIDQTFVYRAVDGRAHAVPVETFEIVDRKVLVRGELNAGDRVVVEGLDNLADQARIRVLGGD